MAGYPELRADIASYLHEPTSEFADKIDGFIQYGQVRVCRELKLSSLQVESTGYFSVYDPFVPVPSTMVAMVQLCVIVPGSGAVPLRPRSVDWITEFWPDRSAIAPRPKYWAPFDDDRLIVAPTPDSGLAWRMTTRNVKASLTAEAPTNQLTSRFYDLLLWACCARGALWLHDDRRQAMIDRFEGLFERDKAVLQGNELERRTDEYTEREPPGGA